MAKIQREIALRYTLYNIFSYLRKRWDLNPRRDFSLAAFRERCFQPLSHSSRPSKYNVILAFFVFFTKNAIFQGLYRRPHRLMVRTSPFQGGNPGSTPGGVTFRNLVRSKRKIWARRRRAVWRGYEIRLAGAGEFGGRGKSDRNSFVFQRGVR